MSRFQSYPGAREQASRATARDRPYQTTDGRAKPRLGRGDPYKRELKDTAEILDACFLQEKEQNRQKIISFRRL